MKLYHFQRHSFSVSLRDREVPYYKANGVGIRLLIEGLHLNQTDYVCCLHHSILIFAAADDVSMGGASNRSLWIR